MTQLMRSTYTFPPVIHLSSKLNHNLPRSLRSHTRHHLANDTLDRFRVPQIATFPRSQILRDRQLAEFHFRDLQTDVLELLPFYRRPESASWPDRVFLQSLQPSSGPGP